MDGEKLIKALCVKVKINGQHLYDSNILSVLRKLTKNELQQLIETGTVKEWLVEKKEKY